MSIYSHVCQGAEGARDAGSFHKSIQEGLFVLTELKSKREIGALLKMVSSYNVNDPGTLRKSPGVFSCCEDSSGQKEEPSGTGNRTMYGKMKPQSF